MDGEVLAPANCGPWGRPLAFPEAERATIDLFDRLDQDLLERKS
jgi:hypothetical protein